MELTGTVSNGVVILDEPGKVPDGARVLVHLAPPERDKRATPSELGKRLLKHAGTVSGLPEDLAEQHDHYIHGTPKR